MFWYQKEIEKIVWRLRIVCTVTHHWPWICSLPSWTITSSSSSPSSYFYHNFSYYILTIYFFRLALHYFPIVIVFIFCSSPFVWYDLFWSNTKLSTKKHIFLLWTSIPTGFLTMIVSGLSLKTTNIGAQFQYNEKDRENWEKKKNWSWKLSKTALSAWLCGWFNILSVPK